MKMISKEDFQAGNLKRKQILSICYQLPTEKGFTKWSDGAGRRIVDYDHLNGFLCGKHSIYKKKLNYHTSKELSKVIIQFQNILKGYL